MRICAAMDHAESVITLFLRLDVVEYSVYIT